MALLWSRSRFTTLLGALVLIVLGSVLSQHFSFAQQGGEVSAPQNFNPSEEFPTCLDNYTTLPSSTTPRQGQDWELAFMPTMGSADQNRKRELFIDVNGDGLLDYLFTDRANTPPFKTYQDCLYLNTGAGWEPAYRCYYNSNISNLYYGDCADTAS